MQKVRDYFARLLAIVWCVAFISSPAVAQDDLEKRVKDLTKELTELNASSDELDPELEKLREQLDKLQNKELADLKIQLSKAKDAIDVNIGDKRIANDIEALRLSINAYQKQDPEKFITAIAQTLSSFLKDMEYKIGGSTADALETAAYEIESVEYRGVLDVIERRALSLDALIKKSPSVLSRNVDVPNLNELRTTLLRIEAQLFRPALSARVDRLVAMLKPPAIVNLLLDKASREKLAELEKAVKDVQPAASISGVHVISAYFGRISGPKSAGGICNALPAVQKECEGKGTCQFPTNWQGVICGGDDPAPFAESRHKGLILKYACLSASAQQWTELLAGVKGVGSFNTKIKSAIFRTGEDQVLCKAD